MTTVSRETWDALRDIMLGRQGNPTQLLPVAEMNEAVRHVEARMDELLARELAAFAHLHTPAEREVVVDVLIPRIVARVAAEIGQPEKETHE